MNLNHISFKIYRNRLTGEFYITKNKTQAWIYFYEMERNKAAKNFPTMDDITEIWYQTQE